MVERNVGRPWTAQEDQLLIQAVNLYGDNDNWKTIALSVPLRTNKACRKRWLHSLCPDVKKSAWTSDEDQRLLQLYALYGAKWSAIARQIPGRTDDACSKRYREALDPSLKKDEWTMDEDEKLVKAYQRLGGKWGQVGQELKRSGLGCRNRWRLLERRKASMITRGGSDNAPRTQLVETHSTGEHSQSLSWQNSILVEPPMFWHSHVYPGNSLMDFHGHRSSPQPGDSPMSTLECTPASHHIPLAPSEDVPPFQYASSSLSAALSGPRPLQPLPVNSDVSQDRTYTSRLLQPELMSSDISSPHNDTSANMMPEENISDDCLDDSGSRNVAFINDPTDSPAICGSSTVPHPQECPFRKSGSLASDDTTMQKGPLDNIASTSSSPLGLAGLTLSSTANSPLVASPVDLPSMAPSGSILFSSHSIVRPRTRKSSTSRKRSNSQGPLRLSSNLSVTSDPSILPYACGHERCWPSNHATSYARFSTSKDLSEHGKTEHADDPGGDGPYRCGLESCGKSWKSINGLQYHLQISRAHFQHAISSALLEKPSVDDGTSSTAVPDGLKKTKKLYPCSHPHCPKVYRQLSGLRYHLSHGHPQEMPAQLEIVPPTLARKVAEKMYVNDPSSKS